MTPEQAVAYIEDYTWSTSRLGLERTQALLKALGDPQKRLKFVHVAGSNGKGSTCAMLESILRRAGYRTGLYISPYIQDFNERIQVDGEHIPGDALARITQRVRLIADRMEDHPSQFELVTAIAMVYFLEQSCDIVVLEVGMGGALDSTNAIDAPEVAIITNIGLEHTEYLGNTLTEIAAAKGGIIKPGCTAVCYDGAPEVTETIQNICREKSVPLRRAGISQITPLGHDLVSQHFLWRDQRMELPLLGTHQLHNAAVVLETVQALLQRGWAIGDTAIREGLRQVAWPARFEVLSHAPLFILDGGHNPQCAQALADNLTDYLPGQELTFLMGVLADKDRRAMLDLLTPYARHVVCVTPDSPRALPGEALAGEISQYYHLPVTVCGSLEEGIRKSLGLGRPVVAFGSLYMAGGIRSAFPRAIQSVQREMCLAARRALPPRQRASFSHTICLHLTQLPAVQQAHTIFSYMAAYDEVDLSEFHGWAQQQGKVLAFPVSRAGGKMDAMVPRDADSWETGRYGISEPAAARSRMLSPEEIDLVLVPCVGFDLGGGRIGHGAGYYDRYLPQCSRAQQILVAYGAQRVERVIQKATDQPVPFIVTESGPCKSF